MNGVTAPRPLTAAADPWAWRLLAVLAVLTGWRLLTVWTSGLGLFYDEAYYWHWSQDLAWGYYSKPPMLAWLIATTNAIFGDATPLAVKSGAFLVHPLTAIGLFVLGKRLADARAGFIAALLYFTAPGVALSGLIISTDVPLLCCWVWGMVCFHRGLRDGGWANWIAAGALAGMGLLSKYTMILFLPSVFIVLARADARAWLRRPEPYMAMIIAAALFIPHIVWNANNGFPTLQHTVDLSGVEKQGSKFNPGRLAEFFGAQFGVFGPVAFGLFLGSLKRWRGLGNAERFAVAFAMPMLAVVSVVALESGANANWAAPAILGVCLAAGLQLAGRASNRLLIIALVINLALAALVYHLPTIWRAVDGQPPVQVDPAYRNRGWAELSEVVMQTAAADPDALIVSEDRAILASIAYYGRADFSHVRAWFPPGQAPRHHYQLTVPLPTGETRPLLFLSGRPLSDDVGSRFAGIELVTEWHLPIARNRTRDLYAYRLTGFRGYAQ